jgi:hypothetical protein
MLTLPHSQTAQYPHPAEFALVDGSFDRAEREREQLICSSNTLLHVASDDNELAPFLRLIE